MHVRSFQLSDVSPVTDLLQTALSEECFENTIEPFSRQLSWDSDLIVVAEDEEEIVGALIGTIEKTTVVISGLLYILIIAAEESVEVWYRLWNPGFKLVRLVVST